MAEHDGHLAGGDHRARAPEDIHLHHGDVAPPFLLDLENRDHYLPWRRPAVKWIIIKSGFNLARRSLGEGGSFPPLAERQYLS